MACYTERLSTQHSVTSLNPK